MDPLKELALAIDKRSKGHANKVINDLRSELGTITETGLIIDNFKHEIRDYLVSDHLTLINGDRVLVLPIGQDFVVVARVVPNA
nr:hypothetical protein 6 [bacterium]BDD46359.1 hypothetical protein 5 [Pelagibacterales bacterium]